MDIEFKFLKQKEGETIYRKVSKRVETKTKSLPFLIYLLLREIKLQKL